MLPFDELNRLNKRNRNQRSMPYKKYFGEMELPESEKKIREEYARDIEREIFLILAFIYSILESKTYYMLDSAKDRLEASILRNLRKYTMPDSELLEYVRNYSSQFVDVTYQHSLEWFENQERVSENVESEETDTPDYWFSEDRARYNAENESNTVFNYEQFRDAKRDGLQYKQWQSMKDERVRKTHSEVDDTILPIDEPFTVGGYLMRYPKDASLGAGIEEIAGCRCTVRYF